MSKRAGSLKGRRASQSEPIDDLGGQDGFDLDNEEIDLQPVEKHIKPDTQIELTEEEKNEVFTKTITAADPNVATSITRYDYVEGEFKVESALDHLAVHFIMTGDLIDKDSDEARMQSEYERMKKEGKIPKKKKAEAGTSTEEKEEEKKKEDAEKEKEGEGDEGDEGEEKKEGDEGDEGEEKAEEKKPEPEEEEEEEDDMYLKNQFNFSERATQTFNNPKRDKEICTEPPPTIEFSETVTQWAVFDGYLQDMEEKARIAAESEQKKPAVTMKKAGDDEDDVPLTLQDESERVVVDVNAQIFNGSVMQRSLKMMERMVHTNSEADFFQEYKYFEDKNELKREDGRGSFHSLWKFQYEQAVKTVSTICWNPEFTDLFAVGYGSYDFVKQTTGMICCFTLKNTSHPEYVIETESGVMSLDFHPVHSSLLCVGLYDGTVCVYDVKEIKSTGAKPIFVSTDPKSKHTDPVWQVYWSRETPEEGHDINFFSVSSDGRVTNWILSKNDLVNEEIVELKLFVDDKVIKDDDTVVGLAGGCCFDFNKTEENLFVVGTEEGAIHYYSKAYNAQFLRNFQGHHMAVYSVRWNTFHPKVFLSCSADWTVKLWECGCSKPVMTFDLNTSVGDVAWAPFSSTVFATITTEGGKVRVYYLAVNKHEPIGETRLKYLNSDGRVKKSNLTHVSFNPTEPILCVGDNRGVITILKLSSNLRKTSATNLEDIDPQEEIAKLEKVMIMPDDEGEEDIQTLLDAAKQIGAQEEQADAVDETIEEE